MSRHKLTEMTLDFQSSGVQFPQRPPTLLSNHTTSATDKNGLPGGELGPSKRDGDEKQIVPESRYDAQFSLLSRDCRSR